MPQFDEVDGKKRKKRRGRFPEFPTLTGKKSCIPCPNFGESLSPIPCRYFSFSRIPKRILARKYPSGSIRESGQKGPVRRDKAPLSRTPGSFHCYAMVLESFCSTFAKTSEVIYHCLRI